MDVHSTPALHFLWHPGTHDIFSGYGLIMGPAHLVGLIMIDRPEPVDPTWLATLQRAFGAYRLTAMTTSGERGLVCQMRIAPESTPYLKVLSPPRLKELREVLLPLRDALPAVTLALAWSPDHRCWVSQMAHATVPLFPLSVVVGTQGGVRALQEAGQGPHAFLDRHVRGDWGELDERDKQENVFLVQHGFRILSAYTTSAGDRIWVITEADRSATTLLLPEEY